VSGGLTAPITTAGDLIVTSTMNAFQLSGLEPLSQTNPAPGYIASSEYRANTDGFFVGTVQAGDTVAASVVQPTTPPRTPYTQPPTLSFAGPGSLLYPVNMGAIVQLASRTGNSAQFYFWGMGPAGAIDQ
jgi:hypothetical protein